jgi:hypothetical protein
MIKPNFIFKVASLFVLCLVAVNVSFAQTDVKNAAASGYDVVLQVLSGSNESDQKSSAPANLAAVVKKINNNFSFSNYRLSNTYISSVADSGSVEYKSFSNDFSQIAGQPETPIFLDWSFVGLKDTPDAGTPNLVQIQSFRFGARVPIKMGNGTVNYESIGLTLQRISVPKNVPTLVGTLPTTKSDETIFLVLTVKPIE